MCVVVYKAFVYIVIYVNFSCSSIKPSPPFPVDQYQSFAYMGNFFSENLKEGGFI